MSQPDQIDDLTAALPALLTIAEVCAFLRCSRRNLSRHLATGRIAHMRPAEAGSSRVLIPRTALASYLRSIGGAL